MRIPFVLIISLLFVSCQIDIDDDNIERIPVFDIQIPESLIVNVENTVSFKYALVNGCYSFYTIKYDDSNDNIRVITAFAIIDNNTHCTENYREETFELSFKPKEAKTYLFKFWIGQNDQGIDEFEEFELVVE